MNQAQFDKALAEAEEALQITRLEGNPIQIAQALLDCAQVRRHKLQLTEALISLQEAEDLLRPFGKTWELAQVLIERGAVLNMQGKYDAAIALFDEVEPIYEKQANKSGLGRCRCDKGMSLCMHKSVKEGFDLMRAGEELLAKAGDNNMLTQSLKNRHTLGLQLAQSNKAKGDMFTGFVALCEAIDAAWRLDEAETGNELAVVASNTVPRLTHELADSGEVDKAIYVWAKNEEVCAHLGKVDEQLASLGAQASLMRFQGYPAEKIGIVLGRAQTVAQGHPDQKRAKLMMSMMSDPVNERQSMAIDPRSSSREECIKQVADELNRPAHEVHSLVQEALKLMNTDPAAALKILEGARRIAMEGAPDMLMFVEPLIQKIKMDRESSAKKPWWKFWQ